MPLPFFQPENSFSEISQDGSNNSQQIANSIVNNNYLTTPVKEVKKASILQQVIEDILELAVQIEATEIDVKAYSIEHKIDYNQIECYKESFDFFMNNKQVIQSRLDILETSGNALATKKLFAVIQNIYNKHIYIKIADDIIRAMQDELSSSLLKIEPENYENISFVPSVIFYVFSECQIFKKPPA